MNQKSFFCQVLLYLTGCNLSSSLLYPASTSLGSDIFCNDNKHTEKRLSQPTCPGLTSSVSVPVAEFFPERRILVDWCFAISYDLPQNLNSFYSIPIWPGFANYKAKREVPRTAHNDVSFYAKYGYDASTQTHPKDFSAGELYATIEDTLSSYGFHDTCLLRSVCELATHPFHEDHQHLLSDILTFILSPSQHEGFLESEHVYKQAYEQAELEGFLGNDCAQIYAHCKHDILRLISNVIFPNS